MPLHYGAAVKLVQKWPTLTNYFFMNFDQRYPSCLREKKLPYLLKNQLRWKYLWGKWAKMRRRKKLKTCWGCYLQTWLISKSFLLQKGFFLWNQYLWKRPPSNKTNGSKSENYKFTSIFTRFFRRGQFSQKGLSKTQWN